MGIKLKADLLLGDPDLLSFSKMRFTIDLKLPAITGITQHSMFMRSIMVRTCNLTYFETF